MPLLQVNELNTYISLKKGYSSNESARGELLAGAGGEAGAGGNAYDGGWLAAVWAGGGGGAASLAGAGGNAWPLARPLQAPSQHIDTP
jgi:hypothetical protein